MTKPVPKTNKNKPTLKKKPLEKLPASLPFTPSPPGEHPQLPTREELEAQAKFWTEFSRVVATYFTFDDLQEIVERVCAPSLKDTANTRAIIRAVCGGIQNKISMDESIALHRVRTTQTQNRKSWVAVRNHVTELQISQLCQITYFNERPYFGTSIVQEREALLKKLKTLSSAMDDVESRIFITSRRSKGQHGPSSFQSAPIAADIFVRLNWAWEEAGEKPATAAKRYQIIRDCLEPIDGILEIDTIKKGISKHLREYPHVAKKENNGS